MNIVLKHTVLVYTLLLLISCNTPGEENRNTIVSLKTTLGDIKIKLYDSTPIHRDNFIKLLNTGFYDGISFHRVIKDFMIQAGDPMTKSGAATVTADSLKTYTIPAEFNNQYFHKKGALAAARQGNDVNPQMRSSGTQFYIVQGVKYTDEELNLAEQRVNSNLKQALFNKLLKETADSASLSGKALSEGEIQEVASVEMFKYLTNNKEYKLTEEQRNIYKNIGGTPRLDATYTVFGEVIEGLEIVDKIAAVQTDTNDKPVNDIRIIKIKIIKN
jgi:cyclophilin family peptidyl-prolyl cis-trans isomerase